MAKKKYYVVWNGVTPGIYHNWNDCLQQTKGYPSAKFKSYKTLAEAKVAFSSNPDFTKSIKKTKATRLSADRSNIIQDSWSVDAACSGNPGVMEYQGVHTADGVQIFHQKFPLGTNNIGEFLAIVHALALLKKLKLPTTSIYTDSRNAMIWVRKQKAKTTLIKNENTLRIHEAILRAEIWLKNNSVDHPIIKWETKSWGDIPADFGRK